MIGGERGEGKDVVGMVTSVGDIVKCLERK
jgi:hypothetical protein